PIPAFLGVSMRRAAHVVAVCAALLLTACSSGGGKSAPTPPPTTQASPSASASRNASLPGTSAPTLSQGQSAVVYDQSATQNPQGSFLKLTVDAVKTATSVVDHSIGSTSTPSAGKQYLFVQLTLNNVGNSPINPSDFSGT